MAALKTKVRQQVGFYGWLGSLQDPPYHQVNHPRGCTHKINHLCVTHIAHICVIHLELENTRHKRRMFSWGN